METTSVSEESTDRDSAGTSTGTNDLVAKLPDNPGITDNSASDSVTPPVNKSEPLRCSTRVSKHSDRYGC